MKNRNLAKILTLVLSLALLIGSVAAINVSAETDEIAGVSIVHGAKIQIAIAAEAGATVTYKWGAEGETLTAEKGDVIVSDNAAVNGKTAYLTEGVAYYELGKVCYINVNGEEITYSVAQFLFAQKYREKVTGTALACYDALLALGDASQIHLDQNADALPSESTYAYTNDANILVNNGDNFAFAPTGVTTIIKPSYINDSDEYTGFVVDNTIIAKGRSIEIRGVSEVKAYTGVVPTHGLEFEANVTSGINLYTSNGNHQTALTNTAPTDGRNGAVGILTADPKDATNQVLQILINGGGKEDGSYSNTSQSSLGGYCTIDMPLDADSVAGGKIHIVEFDFYLERACAKDATWRNPFTFVLCDKDGNVMKHTDSAGATVVSQVCTSDKDNTYAVNMLLKNLDIVDPSAAYTNSIQVNISGNQSEAAGGKFYLAEPFSWIRYKMIWNTETGKANYLYSLDKGENWYYASSEQQKRVPQEGFDHIRLAFTSFTNNAGTFYFDNIDYLITNTMPTLPTDNGVK